MSQVRPLSSLAPEYDQLQPMSSMQQYQTVKVDMEQCQQVGCSPEKITCPQPQEECCPKPECPPPEDKCCPKPACPNPCSRPSDMGWGWLGALILWFIIFTVLFWLIFYSLKPSFVLQTDSNQVDTSKVLLAAVIAALILVAVIWLIKATVSRRYW